jgi:hypothetical protein
MNKRLLVLSFFLMTVCGCSTITPQTGLWRINDKEGSAVYIARNLTVHLHSAGAWVFADGTITITPTQSHGGEMAHVDSTDSWRIPLREGSGYYFDRPPGTEVTSSDVKIRETAFVTTEGVIHFPISGNGYDFVTFRDIETGKQVKITKFSAVAVMTGEITGAEGVSHHSVEECTKSIELKPDDASAYYNRGIAKQTIGDLDGAISDFTEAIHLRPEFAAAYNNRGVAKLANRDWDGAIVDYSKAIELKPDYAKAYKNRSIAKRTKGDYDGAHADYVKCEELEAASSK